MADRDDIGQFEALTVGERLKRAREEKGLSLDAVAAQTRIPIRHLQNIEREDWDALPAITYAIGFARNYATAVGMDGAALARELREQIGGPRARTAAPEYYEQADPARVPPRSLAIAALVLAALLIVGYLLWRSGLDDDAPDAAPVAAIAVPEEAPAPAPAAPQAVAGQPVTLVATGEVWLRITDGPGGPVLRMGAMRAGDRFEVPATARRPIIRTGRPHLLRVSIGGRDLGPVGAEERTIDNVSLLPQDLAARQGRGQGMTAPAPAAPSSAPPPAQ
jgi:cytoskeleton protein RodZ